MTFYKISSLIRMNVIRYKASNLCYFIKRLNSWKDNYIIKICLHECKISFIIINGS